MSVRINLEIGHEASIRTKRTPEGFTHDWEVFVRGCDGAEIQYYVEKVVFYLHETFSKPRRVVKEPPYSVKESGYAGFNLPIEIYLRNKDELKKIRFNYDLHLQPSGPAIIKVQKEKYIFNSPSDEFKHKLLKGGGVTVVSSNSLENSELIRTSSEARNELINKPKLGGSDLTKKHKMKLDEPRVPNSFQDLFGTPITKTAKVFSESKPVPKDVNKNAGGKLEKDKDKNKEKSKYSPAKEKDRDKQKEKSESDRKKDEKRNKDRSRERVHSKEMSSKREKSPKPRSPSPKRSPKRMSSPKRPPSPPPIKHKEKEEKRPNSSKEKDTKDRLQPDEKLEKKSKKEKRDKEHKENKHKDKESQKPSEYKDHKKEPKPAKELAREKEPSPSLLKVERKDKPKEKDSPKETPKEVKDVIEILPEKSDKIKNDKIEEKPKHKHKKKDKERKDKEKSHKERIKDKDKQQQQQQQQQQPPPPPPPPQTIVKYPEITKEIREDKANLFSSPKNDEKTKKANLFSEGEMDSSNSSMSSREDSFVESPEKVDQKKESLFEVKKPKTEFDKSKPKKEKSKKNKEKKGEKEEKKRKRKSERTEEEPAEKIPKEEAAPSVRIVSSDSEQNSNASQPVEVEKENQENPEDYMQILRDLQHKIMSLQDNSELQKVVQLIAETGRYEVSARTFDFDLCLLEKSTVRQLQEFFASSS